MYYHSIRMQPDQLIAKKPILKLNNQSKGTPAFWVHSIEGVTWNLKELAGHVDVPVYGVQWGPHLQDSDKNTIEAVAQFYLLVSLIIVYETVISVVFYVSLFWKAIVTIVVLLCSLND